MKYQLIIGLLLSLVACQSDLPSVEARDKWLLATSEQSAQQVQLGIKVRLAYKKEKHREKKHYKAIWPKIDTLLLLNDLLLDKIEHDFSLDSIQDQLLKQKKMYIAQVASLWKDGGVKGTIFADPRREYTTIELFKRRLDETLELDKTEVLPKHLTRVIRGQAKAELQRMSYCAINFLLGNMNEMGYCYSKFDIISVPTNCLHEVFVGNTFSTEIMFHKGATNQLEYVLIDGDTLHSAYYGDSYYECAKKLDKVGDFEATVEAIVRGENHQLKRIQKTFSYYVNP